VTLADIFEKLNSACKVTDIDTKFCMVVVNEYIKVVLRRIFLISAINICNFKDDTSIIQLSVTPRENLNSGRWKGKLTNRIFAGTQERSYLDCAAKGFSNFVECGWLGSE
jgi:hypothetical protein